MIPRKGKREQAEQMPEQATELPQAELPGNVDPQPAGEALPAIEPLQGYDARLLRLNRTELTAIREEIALLDAWYATFDDHAPETRNRLTRVHMGPQSPGMAMNEVIIGADDRVQVQMTTESPWSCICALRITAADGSRWSGTGWLAAPGLVITAGHCVYIHRHDGWAQSIEVIPGCNGVERPYASCIANRFRSVAGWVEDRQRNHDYGAILLPASYLAEQALEVFGYAPVSDDELADRIVNLAGYPGDKPPSTQWFHARRVERVDAYTLIYNVDTAGGQSGAPVWVLTGDQRYVVGVHTNGDLTGNSATRINQAVFANIELWKSDAVVTASEP